MVDLLARTDFMEKAGTGIKRVTNACVENGNEVNFEFSDSFWITIQTKNKKNSFKNVPENAPENVPENVPEKRLNAIMELVTFDAGISMLLLAKKIGVDHKTIKRDIAKLKALGLLKRIGPAKGGHWEVTK